MKNFTAFLLSILFIFSVSCTSKKRQARYLDYKSFKGSYAKVNDSLYAGISEVSNSQFNKFLDYLRVHGQETLAINYNFDTAKWVEGLSFWEPMAKYYHSHSAYKDYPAVNVSYESAAAYCQWLTNEYQKNPNRMFKKVVFRLPTESEWKQAARGGKESYLFPWGGPFLRNSKGNHLANYRSIPESSAKDTVINDLNVVIINRSALEGVVKAIGDNGIITTPVKSYWPNLYGLYNMAGNVSEMLAEKGHTKGGNWKSLGYYLRIDAEDEFGGKQLTPSPLVGFRVFAEVLER
ncbi:MAG: SUMF1/EgtB/PvdO family nonheme iron enzyme [Bacteroidota bacterium]